MTAYMLDTNVLNKLLGGEVSIDAFRGLRLVATHVQLDEIKATKNPTRAAKLLSIFEGIDQRLDPTNVGRLGRQQVGPVNLAGRRWRLRENGGAASSAQC